MKLKKISWLVISGGSWIVVGLILLIKGVYFIGSSAVSQPVSEEGGATITPLLESLTAIAGSREKAAIFLISSAIFLGFIKGRTLLAKTAKRIIHRIQTKVEGEKIPIYQVYDRKYYLILALMMGIGAVFRLSAIALDVRGVIDITIGSALINGALFYFRQAFTSGSYTQTT